MKKFILEKNFQTGMTVHPQTTPPTSLNSSQPSTSSSCPSPSSLSPLPPLKVNGYNSNAPSKSHQGVNSSQLIHSPATNSINSIVNHNESGFQPYRGSNAPSSLEEGLLSSAPPHSSQSSGPSVDNPGPSSSSASVSTNLANHILPYSERLRSAAAAAGYNYNPFLGPPSHANSPANMPPSQSSQHSHHSMTSHISPQPPSSYRIDEPIYLERYGIMRPGSSNIHQAQNVQSLNHSELSPGHSTSSSNVPSYQMSSRYSELLATHQERVLNDEKLRLLGHGANSNHVTSHSHQHPPVSSSVPSNYKMINTSSHANNDLGARGRDYLNNGNLMSVMSVRDMSSSNMNKKQVNGSGTISNPGSKPLNLTSNSSVISNKNINNTILIDIKKDQSTHLISQQFGHSSNQFSNPFAPSPVTTTSTTSSVNNHLWRPQISEREDSKVNTRIHPDMVKRSNAFEIPIDYSYTKKQRFHELPGDFSVKPVIENPPESYTTCNPSPFFINSSDLISQLKSKTHPLQHNPPSPPHQSNFNQQSKKLAVSEIPPANREPTTAAQKDQNSPNKPPELETKVISKLDMMEIKLKARRKERLERPSSSASVDTNDDEISSSEYESDDDECEFRRARHRLKYMITKGPPLKLDTKPEKIDFLGQVGLVTHKTSNDILFKTYVSNRRFSSNIDAKPFIVSNVPKPELHDSENLFLQPTDILPCSLNKAETKFEDKCGFMNILGLKHELNTDKLKERELIWEGVLEERDRRRSINLSYGKITNNLSKEALDKWLNYLSSQPRIYLERYNKNGIFSTNTNTNTSLSSLSSFSSPSSLEHTTPLAVSNSWHNQRRTLNVTDRKHSKSNNSKQGLLKSLDNKDFAQKHLKQKAETAEKRKDDLVSTKCINEKSELYSDSGHKDTCSTSDLEPNHAAAFKWPGVEAIMEAYEKYALDASLEKEFLSERIAELKSTVKEKGAHADKLTNKIASLTNVRRELDEERERYEKKINVIKTNLNKIAHSLEIFQDRQK